MSRTVKNSKRPSNIKKLNSHLAGVGNAEKFPEGPTKPKPGPTLLKQVTAAPTRF